MNSSDDHFDFDDLMKFAHERALNCEGGDCPLKEECWRFIKPLSGEYNFKINPPFSNGECDMFINKNKKV
jgi:hypothetical protein